MPVPRAGNPGGRAGAGSLPGRAPRPGVGCTDTGAVGAPRLLRIALVLGCGVAAVATAGPAAAHPFGPPPTAQVNVTGTRITIVWTATPDDAVAIGELLGLMPEGSTALYRQDSAAQVAPSRAEEAALSAAPKLHDYLTEHIVVLQDDRPCPADVPPIDDFVHEGARVVLTCPEPVTEIDLRITMLHAIHPAYRTFAVGEGAIPGESVFTVESPQHTWRFGEAASPQLGFWHAAAVGAASGGAVGAVIALRRRRRRTSP